MTLTTVKVKRPVYRDFEKSQILSRLSIGQSGNVGFDLLKFSSGGRIAGGVKIFED